MKKSKFYSFIIYFVVLLPAFALAALLISCKGDTGTGPSTGGPQQTNDSLIFQKDSIVLRSNTNDSLHVFYRLDYQDSLKFEFEGLTNIDSSKANMSVGVFVYSDTVFNPLAYFLYGTYSPSDLNRTHSYHLGGYYNPLVPHFFLKIRNSYSIEMKYIILKNIKVYKVKP